MKKLAIICLMSIAVGVKADLFWYNTGAITDFNGDLVPASQTDSTVGFFAQLIFAGANGTPDAFTPTGNGVSGDDVVADTMFAGEGFFLFEDGFFPLQTLASVVGSSGNGSYYVRVFDAPNPDFSSGTSAPVVGSYYWESATYSYTHSPTIPDQFDFAPSGGQTTIAVVPEPSVIAIMGLGLFGLASARRRLQA
jgi:hypothetical protein